MVDVGYLLAAQFVHLCHRLKSSVHMYYTIVVRKYGQRADQLR